MDQVSCERRKKYNDISDEKRNQLINLCMQQSFSINKAAELLGIIILLYIIIIIIL